MGCALIQRKSSWICREPVRDQIEISDRAEFVTAAVEGGDL